MFLVDGYYEAGPALLSEKLKCHALPSSFESWIPNHHGQTCVIHSIVILIIPHQHAIFWPFEVNSAAITFSLVLLAMSSVFAPASRAFDPSANYAAIIFIANPALIPSLLIAMLFDSATLWQLLKGSAVMLALNIYGDSHALKKWGIKTSRAVLPFLLCTCFWIRSLVDQAGQFLHPVEAGSWWFLDLFFLLITLLGCFGLTFFTLDNYDPALAAKVLKFFGDIIKSLVLTFMLHFSIHFAVQTIRKIYGLRFYCFYQSS